VRPSWCSALPGSLGLPPASYHNDIDIVARAGIFRVLTAGISDLVDTFLLIALATAAYLVSLWALRRGFRHGFTAAIAGTVLACLSMLPAMPLTSPDAVHLAADVRTFWLHGKWPADGENAPATIDDPVANEVRVFRNQPSGYGPLAYAIGGAPLPFVGDGFRANLLGQKVVAGIFLTLTAAAAGLIARRLGQNAELVAGMIGLNPMMTWQFPGDGHNDTIMAFFGVVAVGLVIQPGWRERGAGVASGLAAALCKYGLLLASPIVAAWWFPRWRNALAALAAIGGAAVLFLYIIDAGPVNNGTLGPAGAVARTTPWGVLASITDAGSAGEDRMVVAGYLLFLMTLAVIMLWHPLETQIDLIRGVALAMGLFPTFARPLPGLVSHLVPAFRGHVRVTLADVRCTRLTITAFLPSSRSTGAQAFARAGRSGTRSSGLSWWPGCPTAASAYLGTFG